MSLFDQASLIVTPNAINVGKLYSIKPTDGSGDLDVVRATSATIPKNAQGLVEVPRTNLLTNSDGNLTTYTTNSNVSDAVIPINGFVNSIQFGDNSVSRVAYKRNFTPTIGVQYTLSVFVQMDDDSLPNIGITNISGDFSLIINGNTANINVLAQRVNDTNVYKCSSSFVAISTNTQFGVAKFATQSVKGFRITGVQLETGVTATEYIPTTSVIRTKFAGITQDGGSASNIARLDYSNGSCPSILVEPQRTNLLLRSEEFDNSYWTKTRSAITTNTTTSPDGTINADKLIDNTTASATHQISRNITGLSVGSYTMSVFAKKGEYNFIRFWEDNQTGRQCYFNLDNGTVTNVNMNSVSIENFGNGWYRCIATINLPSAGDFGFRVNLSPNGTTTIYNGDGVSGVYIWGAQLEAGANATSYIPTVASAVTRNADVIYKTGISDLIGQTEGTIFCEVDFKNASSKIDTNRIIELTDGTNTNRIIIAFGSPTALLTRVTSSGVEQASFSSSVSQGKVKILLKYSSSGVYFFVNGVLAQSNLSATIPVTSRLNLGYQGSTSLQQLNDGINICALFKTQLTDQQCIDLTTP